MDPNNEISKILSNIKNFRELKRITREQMASDLEMTASGYSKIERGENELSVFRLLQIAMALDVSVSQILNFDINSIFNTPGNPDFSVSTAANNDGTEDYREKYISKLEEEIERLKQVAKKE